MRKSNKIPKIPERSIGKRLEDIRKSRNEKQEQTASAIGVNRVTIAQWESETRQIKAVDIAKLSAHFGVSADYILCISDNESPINTPMRSMCEYSGLSKKALEILHLFSDSKTPLYAPYYAETVNTLLYDLAFELSRGESSNNPSSILALIHKFLKLNLNMNYKLSHGLIINDVDPNLYNDGEIKINDRIIDNAVLMEIEQSLISLKHNLKEES